MSAAAPMMSAVTGLVLMLAALGYFLPTLIAVGRDTGGRVAPAERRDGVESPVGKSRE